MRKKPHWSWWTKIRRKYVLRNYNLMTLDDMADYWECTVGTIYRDLRELKRHGIFQDYRFKMSLVLLRGPRDEASRRAT